MNESCVICGEVVESHNYFNSFHLFPDTSEEGITLLMHTECFLPFVDWLNGERVTEDPFL